jgi:16S rRNA processing protein RimM
MSNEPKADELVELAAVMRAHGLNGELLLKVFNPESELLFGLSHVFVRHRAGALSTREVESTHQHGGHVLLALKGVQTREQAEDLRGALICVRRDALPALADDEHYFVDLVGSIARDASGQEVGRVLDVIDYPSVCCFVVETKDGPVEVPYTDRYVLELDAKAKSLVVANLADFDDLRPKPKTEPAKKPRPAKSAAAEKSAASEHSDGPKKGEH